MFSKLLDNVKLDGRLLFDEYEILGLNALHLGRMVTELIDFAEFQGETLSVFS